MEKMTSLLLSHNLINKNSNHRRKFKNVNQMKTKISLRKSKVIAINLMKKNYCKNSKLFNEDNENNLCMNKLNKTNKIHLKYQYKRSRKTLNEKTNFNQANLQIFSDSDSTGSCTDAVPEVNFTLNYDKFLNDSNHSNQTLNSNVLVPNWRIINYKATYKLEKTENLNDETYLKRHQKHENEEKQIKRWDMRRQRENYERIKLLKGRTVAASEIDSNTTEPNFPNDDLCVIQVINDKMSANESIVKETVINIDEKKAENNKRKSSKSNRNNISQTNLEPKLKPAKKETELSSFRSSNILSVYDFDYDSDSNVFFDFNFNKKSNKNEIKCLSGISI